MIILLQLFRARRKVFLDYAASTPEGAVGKFLKRLGIYSWVYPVTSHSLGSAEHGKLSGSIVDLADALNVRIESFRVSKGESSAFKEMVFRIVVDYHRNKDISTDVPNIVTSLSEHSAHLEYLRGLESAGSISLTLLSTEGLGFVEASGVISSLTTSTVLVSLMAVNNETGLVAPIDEYGSGIRRYNKLNGSKVRLHSDCNAALLSLDMSQVLQSVDYATFGSAKVFGPKEVGFVYIPKEAESWFSAGALLSGSTTSGIIKKAVDSIVVSQLSLVRNIEHIKKISLPLKDFLVDMMESDLGSLGIVLIPEQEKISPYLISIGVLGASGEMIRILLEERDVFVSGKSACTYNDGAESHVMRDYYGEVSSEFGFIRVSMSPLTSTADIRAFMREFKYVLEKVSDNIEKLG